MECEQSPAGPHEFLQSPLGRGWPAGPVVIYSHNLIVGQGLSAQTARLLHDAGLETPRPVENAAQSRRCFLPAVVGQIGAPRENQNPNGLRGVVRLGRRRREKQQQGC
jgi:hypothetical protein